MRLWSLVWFPPRGKRLRALIDWRWWVFRLIPFRLWIEVASWVSIEVDVLFGPITDEHGEFTLGLLRFWALLWSSFLLGWWAIWRVTDRFFDKYRSRENSN